MPIVQHIDLLYVSADNDLDNDLEYNNNAPMLHFRRIPTYTTAPYSFTISRNQRTTSKRHQEAQHPTHSVPKRPKASRPDASAKPPGQGYGTACSTSFTVHSPAIHPHKRLVFPHITFLFSCSHVPSILVDGSRPRRPDLSPGMINLKVTLKAMSTEGEVIVHR
jgi:hypothetical protein